MIQSQATLWCQARRMPLLRFLCADSPEGSMWECQYVIRKPGKTEVDGFPGRTYFSREEAESAALARAKWLIDGSYNADNLKT